MGEERRSHVTVELQGKRLGMYVEPSDTFNTGCVLVRFEDVDGAMGEAECSGVLRPGFRLTAINDCCVNYSLFSIIIGKLVVSPRPIRLTWRDPSVPEFRDRYTELCFLVPILYRIFDAIYSCQNTALRRFGFLRTKMHVEQEAAAVRAVEEARKRYDHEWIDFLNELGGKRGPSFGVSRLTRDARGGLAFPVEPRCVHW
jgi:hypothetical protein